jgi:predicted RNase H-like HicB family nuclease
VAGTLPHAVFIETGAPPDGGAVAFAAELPGCAAFAGTPDAAVAALPGQVAVFTAWLQDHGQEVPEPVGNWYEVERAASGDGRAEFSLDDLDPSPQERERWLAWLELAREELASRLDDEPAQASSLGWLAAQDRALAAGLDGSPPGTALIGPIDELYAARDRLEAALQDVRGGSFRAAVRIAIADDLRVGFAPWGNAR